MSDSTTPQDGKAMSPASAGSQPVAWAVLPPALPGVKCLVTFDKDEAERIACGAMRVVPLYEQPQPTLTDEERKAVETAMNAYGEHNDDPECEAIEAALWGLLERTK